MSHQQDPVVIVSAVRTPMGAFQGGFPTWPRTTWAALRSRPPSRDAGIAPEKVEEVLFGNCLMAGQGQAPARQAGFKGGLPQSTGAVTLSQNVRRGHGSDHSGRTTRSWPAAARSMVAGGMESMTNAPIC